MLFRMVKIVNGLITKLLSRVDIIGSLEVRIRVYIINVISTNSTFARKKK